MKNRKNGIILSYINTILTMVVGVFLSSFYIKQLGRTEYGVYESISSFINYLVLLEFGTGTAMTRNLSLCYAKHNCDEKEIKKNISTIWSITIFLSMMIILASTLFYFSINNIYINTMSSAQINYAKSIFVILLVYMLSSFYIQTLNGVVLANENYTYSSKISIVKTVCKVLLVVCLVFYRKKAIYIAVVDMIISILILVFTLIYCKKKYNIELTIRYFDKKVFKATMPLCFAMFLQVLVNQANNNVDKFVISVMISPEMVTLYSISLYIYSMFTSATSIPITLYAPQVIKNIGLGKEKNELTETLIQPSRLIVIIGGLILFGFISIGKQFIIILYGKEYIQAWSISIIIMIPMFINMSNGIIINVLDALNKRMVRSLALLLTTILNIFFTIIWVKKWGIIGATTATFLCTLLGQVLIMNIYYYKKLKLPIIYMLKKTYEGILIFQIIAMIISYVISSNITNTYFSFFIGGILFLLVFILLFVAFGKNDIEKKYIKEVLNKMHLKRISDFLYEKD